MIATLPDALILVSCPIGVLVCYDENRFGETLPMVDHILKITPFETHQRRLRTVNDYEVYKKLHATLPAAVLAALKVRVRSGEPRVIQELWDKRDKTFVAVDFENSERNASSVLEWGYAAVRCGHLDTYVCSSFCEANRGIYWVTG